MLATKVAKDSWVQVNPNVSTTISGDKGFHKDESPTSFGSKVEKDLQGFIDELFKVLDAIGVPFQEKAELPSWQLKDVAQVWYEKWKDKR